MLGPCHAEQDPGPRLWPFNNPELDINPPFPSLLLLDPHQQPPACRHRAMRLNLVGRLSIQAAAARVAEPRVAHVGEDDVLALGFGIVGEAGVPCRDVEDGSPAGGRRKGDVVRQGCRRQRLVAARLLPCR